MVLIHQLIANAYQNVSNVVLAITPKSAPPGAKAVLLNAHFDNTLSSPGVLACACALAKTLLIGRVRGWGAPLAAGLHAPAADVRLAPTCCTSHRSGAPPCARSCKVPPATLLTRPLWHPSLGNMHELISHAATACRRVRLRIVLRGAAGARAHRHCGPQRAPRGAARLPA